MFMWLFGKVKTYTAEDVHNELFLLSIMLVKKIEEERETVVNKKDFLKRKSYD